MGPILTSIFELTPYTGKDEDFFCQKGDPELDLTMCISAAPRRGGEFVFFHYRLFLLPVIENQSGPEMTINYLIIQILGRAVLAPRGQFVFLLPFCFYYR